MDIKENAKAVLSALLRAGLNRQEIGDTLACAHKMACSREELRAIVIENGRKDKKEAAPTQYHHIHDGRIKDLIRAVDAIEEAARG